MRIFFGAQDFNELGPDPLAHPGPGVPLAYSERWDGVAPEVHPPNATDMFFVSDLLYPTFSESVALPGFQNTPVAPPGVIGTRLPFYSETFSTPIPYKIGDKPWNSGPSTDPGAGLFPHIPAERRGLGVGIVWRFWSQFLGGPHPDFRSVIKIKLTARRYR